MSECMQSGNRREAKEPSVGGSEAIVSNFGPDLSDFNDFVAYEV